MSYQKTNWKDRVVEHARTYKLQENDDGTVTLIPAPGEVTEAGTPVNSINMNKIEQGIADNSTELDTHIDDEDNPHRVTKSQVGLGDVDNVKQASKTEFDSHKNNKNNPHDTDSEQITRITRIDADVAGTEYPVGLTTMDVGTDHGYPYRGVTINAKNTNFRFVQIFIASQLEGNVFEYRDWHNDRGWSDFTRLADAAALANLLSRYESHIDNTQNAHGATINADPNSIARRMSNGAMRVADPAESSNAVPRGYADDRYASKSEFNAHADNNTAHGASISSTPSRIVRRGADAEINAESFRFGPGPYMDLIYRDGQYELYPTGSGFQQPIVIGREPNRVDLPGGATIEGNDAWHNGNNPASLGPSGYQKLASGLIFQWVRVGVSDTNGTSMAFPIAFPNEAIAGFATASIDTPSQIAVEMESRSRFKVRSSPQTVVNVFAIGR